MTGFYRQQLIVTVGIPGSGKSTVAITCGAGYVHVSSDAARGRLYGDEAEQGDPGAVFATVHRLADEGLAAGRTVVVDATNLRPEHRAPLLKIAADHGVVASAWRITTPLTRCWVRNARRGRRVPVWPMARLTAMWLRYGRRSVLAAEGWHVYEVRP